MLNGDWKEKNIDEILSGQEWYAMLNFIIDHTDKNNLTLWEIIVIGFFDLFTGILNGYDDSYSYRFGDEEIKSLLKEKVLNENSINKDVLKWGHLLLGIKIRAGAYDEQKLADDHFNAALNIDPLFTAVYCELSFYDWWDYNDEINETHIAYLHKCLAIDSTLEIPIYFNIANRSIRDNIEITFEYLSKIIALLPDSDKSKAIAYEERARHYDYTQRDKALEDFNEAERLSGKFTDPYSYYLRAEVLFQENKNLEQAINDLSRIISFETDILRSAYELRARCYNKQALYEKALEDYSSIIESDKKMNTSSGVIYRGYERVFSSRAEIYMKLGKLKEAISDYTSRLDAEYALKEDDKSIRLMVSLLFDRAKAKDLLNDYVGAIDDYSSIINLENKRNKYGSIFVQDINGEAIELQKEHPTELDILFARRNLYEKLGMMEEYERDDDICRELCGIG